MLDATVLAKLSSAAEEAARSFRPLVASLVEFFARSIVLLKLAGRYAPRKERRRIGRRIRKLKRAGAV